MIKKFSLLIALAAISLAGCNPEYLPGVPSELQNTTPAGNPDPGDSQNQPADPGTVTDPGQNPGTTPQTPVTPQDPGTDPQDPGTGPQTPLSSEYAPDFGTDPSRTLAEFGFREIGHVRFIPHGRIETTSPGGLAERTVFRTPEFGPILRNQADGLEFRFKLKFPDPDTVADADYKENHKFQASLLDAAGTVRYTLQYKPNLPGSARYADFILFMGDPDVPGTRFAEFSSGRSVPVGNTDGHATFRLILLPTAAAGGNGEIHVYFDAGDGLGARDYRLATDETGLSFTSIRFAYETGTGALNYRTVLYGIQFKQWLVSLEPAV